MGNLVRVILSMSLSGSALILIIILIRPLLKERFSKAWQYYIWMIVLIRLLVPYSPEYSLVNNLFEANVFHDFTEVFLNDKATIGDIPVGVNTAASQQSFDQSGSAANNNSIQNSSDLIANPTNHISVDYNTLAWNITGYLWLTVVILLIMYKAFHYILFLKAIHSEAEPIADHKILQLYHSTSRELGVHRAPQLLLSNQVASPMLIGLIRPAIILTDIVLQLEDENLSFVLRHELVHYKRHDIWYKWFCELALSVHWFNPLVYQLSRKINSQCEISCDEAVAQDLTEEKRRIYGMILLNTATESMNFNKNILSTTLYEDKLSLKERILSIMNVRRKSKKTFIFSIFVTLLIFTTALMLGACSLKEDTSEVKSVDQNNTEDNNVPEATPTPSPEKPSTDTTENNNSASTGTDQTTSDNQDDEVISNDNIVYSNNEFGFEFTLPASWKDYTIQTEDWQGTALEGDQQGTVVEEGTKIMIRHPEWTADVPRQDIPIMVFTLAQWDQIINEKIAVSAAPIPPSELGRNSKYVFALPARYNFAFPAGYEEVDEIIQNGPLVGNENLK